MTIGERIQMCRKQLGLSQEELGQKLLVSRQTISLWEKDQTVPTIDNLKRLREIFDISVDEILGFEVSEQAKEISPKPNEVYSFRFTKDELNRIYRLQGRNYYKRAIIFTVISILMIVLFVASYSPGAMIGFAAGMFFIGTVSNIKGIRAYSKVWKNSMERICSSIYEYKLYNDCFEINIYRHNELVRKSKYYYTDIEKIHYLGQWLILQIGGQAFILRDAELRDNSVIYTCMNRTPVFLGITERPLNGRLKLISIILFVASLLSVTMALNFIRLIGGGSDTFVKHAWICFLFTLIPIASLVFGFILKSKGYKYKKNIVIGIIMTVMLCLWGSFSFIFADVYDYSNEAIIRTEQVVGIDIPEHRNITTQDFSMGTQSGSGDPLLLISIIDFDSSEVEDFEKQLKDDDRWMVSLSTDLIGIASPLYGNDYSFFDYILLYNADTGEYNTLPKESGYYRFINVFYSAKENQMNIVEYDIDYVK